MYKINEDLSIYVTRGDAVLLDVEAYFNGVPYTFVPGDLVRFKVSKKKNCAEVVLEKDFPVTSATQTVQIFLDKEETKFNGVISKPVDYWYEIELNPLGECQTIIGYDEDGAKVFKLFPEGADKELDEYIPEDEESILKFTDDEFDLTSRRPVENRLIARAISQLEKLHEVTYDAVAELHVTPEMFGAIGDGVADDTAAIKAAINECKNHGGGVVYFPRGVYLTDPIILDENCKNITLIGNAHYDFNKPVDTNASVIKIRSEGSVGIQLASRNDAEEIPSWSAYGITIKGLYLNCNNMVDYGINGNYYVAIEDFSVSHAKKDGILLEGCTFPFILRNIKSFYNGRHGLYAKPPFTTVYNIDTAQFERNGAYGMCIEAGTSCTFKDIVSESNDGGGVKIHKPLITDYTRDNWLFGLVFINLYTENNGNKTESDEYYDGNYALKITNANDLSSSTAISNLVFIGGVINASNAGQGTYIQGTKLLKNINCTANFVVKESENIGYEAPVGSLTYTRPSSNDIYKCSETNNYREDILFDSQKNRLLKVGNGYVGLRGRMRELLYTLDDIAAGEIKAMNAENGSKIMCGYPMINQSSLFDASIILKRKIAKGTLTIKGFYGYKETGRKEGYLATLGSLTLEAGKQVLTNHYTLLSTDINSEFFIGYDVIASNDFAFENSVPGENYIELRILLEN